MPSRLHSLHDCPSNLGLSKSIIEAQNAKKLSPVEEALLEVTLACKDQAADFTKAVDALKITGSHRKWKSFRQALKSVWDKEELEKRTVRLDRLHQQVVIHLLVVVNDGQTKAFAALTNKIDNRDGQVLDEIRQGNTEIKREVKDLSSSLKKLAKRQLADNDNGPRKVEAAQQLVDQWHSQNEEIVHVILCRMGRRNDELKERSFQQILLNSLYFEKIDDRQNMITEKDEVTLGWVFNTPPENQSQWSDVPTWLKSSDGLYWVSGKAGSGKSTLMKWLLHENRTKDLLKAWSGNKTLLVANYFFWGAGSDTQKSLQGLLRSILYDLLRQWPNHIPRISPVRWRSHDLDLSHFPTWSDADLLAAIRSLIEDTVEKVRICLFVDGLDEFVGKDHQRVEIMDLLKNLAAHRHVKICVSSRPWELFKDSFAGYPTLRLEYLTRKDIEKYVRAKFDANDMFERLSYKNSMLCSQLVSEINDKAKGVWLWVVLVVRSLLQGLRNQDTISDLLERLREVPEELEDYFLHMFNKVDRIYRPKALKLLKIALNVPRLTLMTASFLDEDDPLYPFATPVKPSSRNETLERLDLAGSRVNIRCMGLLEIANRYFEDDLFYQKSVEFLHGTAKDFMHNIDTQKLIGMDSIASFDVDLFLCEALLAQIKMSEASTILLLFRFMSHASILESRSSPSITPLLAHLNSVLDSAEGNALTSNARQFSTGQFWRRQDQGPVPLLSLAIQFGLSRYVKNTLLSNPRLVAEQPARPILDFALRRRIYSTFEGQAAQLQGHIGGPLDQPDVEVVRLILDQGGDPNEDYGRHTVWKLFMLFFDVFGSDLQQLDAGARQNWIDVTELLIRYGAPRILDSETWVSPQSSGKARVNFQLPRKFARDSIAAAFGSMEADRLDSLSRKLNSTEKRLLTNLGRKMRAVFRQR